MALTTLNLPFTESSTVQYHQLQPSCTHLQQTTDRISQGTSLSQHPHHRNEEQNQTGMSSFNNTFPERPAGVTTTVHSPFPEAGERRLYTSDDLESEAVGTESETDGAQRHQYYDESAVLPQSPLLYREEAPIYTTSDPLDTSVESTRSLHSTITPPPRAHQVQFEGDRHGPVQHPLSITPPSVHREEGDDTHSTPGKAQHMQDDLETRGRFTSASATPDSQRRVLVLEQTRQAESGSVRNEEVEKA